MGAAVPSDDTEAESVRSSFKSDGLVLRWAEGRAGQSETDSEKNSPAPQSLPTQTYQEQYYVTSWLFSLVLWSPGEIHPEQVATGKPTHSKLNTFEMCHTVKAIPVNVR